jgi:hypothetical protein
MAKQTFNSYDAHAAAVKNANLRATVVGKVSGVFTLSGLPLPGLKAQWGHVASGNIVEGVTSSSGVSIYMPTRNAGKMLTWIQSRLRRQRPSKRQIASWRNWFVEWCSGLRVQIPSRVGA